MGVSGQRHAPAALPLGEGTVPIVSEAEWVPQRYLPNKLSIICLKIFAAAFASVYFCLQLMATNSDEV